MQTFLRQHHAVIHGVLSGFDRIRFRGTVRSMSYAGGFFKYLNFLKVLLIAFKAFVEGTSRKLKKCTKGLAKKTPVGKVVYLSGNRDKQQVIEELMKEHGITESYMGLIAVLSCVENCSSFELHKNSKAGKLELTSAFRKCLHYYLYIRDPGLGLLHIRIMTWFPMRVQICLNGREWLAHQLDAAGISYRRLDNTFEWVADFTRAQKLFDEQLDSDWPALLSGLLQKYHPEFAALRKQLQLHDYYWTAEQTEWATDVSFRSMEALRPLYRRLVRHATENLSCVDVLRFLQQPLTKSGKIHGKFAGEVGTDTNQRVEGVRVKHRMGLNSIKMYDKFGLILRIEVTIHCAEGLKVYRPKGEDGEGKLCWQALRRGVADLYRRCELSQKANETYLEALSVVEVAETLESMVTPVSMARQENGRRYRGLNLLSAEDRQLLQAINRGEYAIAGFRNRDLRGDLFGKEPVEDKELKKRSGRVTRRLQLLRAHGLIGKIPKSHRYRITPAGRKLASALSYASEINLKTLSQVA
jgi:hypothetical protein